MPQPPTLYRPITTAPDDLGLTQQSIDREKLARDEENARKARQAALDAHLSGFADDPVSKALATADFVLKEEEAQKAAAQKEYDDIVSKHDDPVMKAWAVAEHYAKKTDAPEAQKAFADRERLEMLREQEKNAATLDRAGRYGMGVADAFVRETIGSAVNVVPDLAAVVARLKGEQDVATQLNRDSQEFGQAREQSRSGDMSPWLSRMYGGASQSLLQTAATPGGAASKIIGAGVMSGNQAITAAEDAGLEGAAKYRYVGSQALFESGVAAIGQKFFGGGIESRLAGQTVAAQTWKALAKNIGTDALKEMPEEVVTTILQDVSSKLEGVSPDMNFADFVTNATEAAVQAAMMAPMANAGNAAALAFRQKPSKQNYDAAVSAGMPPIDNPNREGRTKYAADLNVAAEKQPAPEPTQKVDSGIPLSSDATPEQATLEPTAPAANPDNAPDIEYDEILNLLQKGDQNEAKDQTGQAPEASAEGQGQAEGLLTEPPAETQDQTTPADSQENRESPAAQTKAEFEAEYRDNFARMMQYTPDQVGSQHYAERMAAMADAHPDWVDEIEKQEASPVATGEPSPDQSQPLTEAGPVSLPEYGSIEKGDDGLFYPSLNRPNKLPQSSLSGFNTQQEAADWFTKKSESNTSRSFPPPKGSIGFNSDGQPIYESKTGVRTVGQEQEVPFNLKYTKGEGQKAVFKTPRQDQFKTEAELAAEKAHAATRHQSAIKKYPARIPHPDVPGREVDAPPVYLTGVSNAESREAAKTTPNLGVMLTPRTQQYRTHLKDYQFFGVDNGAFTGKFNEKGFYKLLDNIREQGDAGKALFATAPDVVGDWQATLAASEPHLDRIRDAGFPVAIVLQNGATVETIPWDRIDALFVGGDDNFKLAQKDKSGNIDPKAEMLPIIKEARRRDVPIHYGRVNSAKRLEMTHFGMGGRSVDGTFIKFGKADAQTEKVMKWLKPWGKFPDAKPAPIEIIESPDLRIARKADEDIQARKKAIKDGGFVSGDQVTQVSTGRKGVLESISDKTGFVAVRFKDGSVLGTDVSGFIRGAKSPAAKPKPKAAAKPVSPANPNSLRSIVLAQGGISTKALRKDYNLNELKANGLLGVMRIQGLPVDVMAQTLESSGDLRTPADRTPADWLMDQLQSNADGARAEYSDEEIGKRLEAEREAYERVKAIEDERIDKAGIEELRQRSEEAGIRAADEGEPDEGFTEAEASEIVDTSFDFGENVTRVGDLVELGGKTGVVTRIRPDGNLTVYLEETMASGRKTSPRYSGFAIFAKAKATKVGTAPFPATLSKFYSKWGDKSAEEITAEFITLWDSLSADDKSRFAHRLRKFGISGAKSTSKADKLAESVASLITKSKDVPGKIREIYDIANEYPEITDSLTDDASSKLYAEMMRRIDDVGLSLPPMVRAAMVLPDMRRELLHNLAKDQFGEDIADSMFNEDATPEADPEAFTLSRPKTPKPKAPDFGTNENTKQTALFDNGKKGELPGQNLLFNTDPGDLQNPNTQENKTPKPATPAAESDIKAAMRAELARQAAEEAAAKPAAAPKKPSKPRKPRTATGQKLEKMSEDTGKAAKKAIDDFLKEMGDLGVLSGFGVNNQALVATAKMVRAQIADGVVKFADFVARFVEHTSPATARKLSDYLEAAWEISGETDSRLDPVGKVADILGPEEAVTNENGPTDRSAAAPDQSMGRSSGESGGTLAPEAGKPASDGIPEAVPGSDSGPVPDGTDSTATGESAGVNTPDAGTGTGTDTGAKSKPRRKPAVSSSRKESGDVPRKVEGPVNLRIQPGDTIAPNGVVSKLKANIAAIKLLKELQSVKRPASEAEQRVLMQYTGWGSLQNAFDENKGNAFIERPGLTQQYGDQYAKAALYQKKGQYSSLEDLQKRVSDWEKQWGEAYKYLKENLTKDEWNRAAASVLNAHFTSRDVITHGIWGALEQMGVTGGRFLEPSAGIGSLIGLMPDSIANASEVVAIELDSLTGDMVKQLYPEADVYVKGFEEVPIPPGTIDIAATNVPFHAVGPTDATVRYGRAMNLHNYFIARTLDALRPGGIAAIISTHFTMDANPQDRALIAERADLVGAIRLPNTAFKANAGTEVTTDIMFFRKPDGSPFKGEAWQNMATVGTHVVEAKGKQTTVPIVANEYFAAHPEMVLGTHSMAGKQYADEDSGTEYTVTPIAGAQIADQLKKAVATLPAGIATTDNAPLMPSMDIGTTAVEGRVEFRNGKLQELSGGTWGQPAWIRDSVVLKKDGQPRKMKEETKTAKIAAAVKQAIAYTKVRNAYETHLSNMLNEDTSQAEYEASQKSLNDTYDSYRAAHGPLNAKDSEFLEGDPGFFFTSGLELEDELIADGKRTTIYSKADVFRERTISTISAPTKAGTTEEAVKLSLAWRGNINLPWMSELTGKTEDELRKSLLESGTVFTNPETGLLEPADTYLSGNVQAKLRAAEQAVKDGDASYAQNVADLKTVQPAKMTIDAITPSLGAHWIPTEIVQQWVRDKVGLKQATISYNEKADIWSVSGSWHRVSQDVQNTWGTLATPVNELLSKVLNGQSTRVVKPELTGETDANGRPKTRMVEDEVQTRAASVKAEKMRLDFEAWAKADEQSIRKLEDAYNEQKNFYVKPQWNGEHLSFPGMDADWLKKMRPYQKNSVWRAIRERRGMIAHGVGAGKTLEMIATAMEMRRLGTATKPLLVVQNSTLGQFARTFTQVYPAAKVLVAGNEDLSPRNRKKFMARISSGNWDAIVMAKSTFNMKLPNDPTREQAMVEGLIDELKSIMLEAELADGKGAPSVKAIQQQVNSLVKRLSTIIDRVNAKTDSDVYFEEMGIDALFLDEAHDYKKPPFVTKLDKNIKGISNEVSGRALSALIKMRFVQDKNNGRNTFMATGTPITNTLGESWLLMNMVAPDVIKEFGVATFDRFVSSFATVSDTLEPNAVGKLVRRTRLAKFKNGHQLGQFIQAGWDVLLGEDLHAKIREYGGGNLPTLDGGKDTLHMVDRTPAFDNFADFFFNVYDAFKALTGKDKREYSWIPVTIYSAAKAAAIDVRLIDPTAPDDPGSKINKMVAGVAEAYRDGESQKLTQLIFSDISGRTSIDKLQSFAAGKGVTLEIGEDTDSEDNGISAQQEDRWLYQEIKRKLIAQGIPAEQIQIINDHNKNAETMMAFQDLVKTGDVRIVIGHSDTLGTGVNVQDLLSQIWELDIPMVPAKREQRRGRIIRSGNTNKVVKINVMAMQKSLDGTLMAMNLRKAKFGEQALMGKLGGEFDDPFSESLMSMADMEAAMNDDPLFYRQRDLEFAIRGLRLDQEALDQQKSNERRRLRDNEYRIEQGEASTREDMKTADALDKVLQSNNPITVNGTSVKTAAEAEAALKAAYKAETERISADTQAGKIPALRDSSPKSDNMAVDMEYGPVQFTLYYGERPEVVQDEKGNPHTKWTSSSGTIITMNGTQIARERGTTYPTIMKSLAELPATLRSRSKETIDKATALKAENDKLREFLAKPYDSQNELNNLQDQLDQVNALMYERDNPAPAVPPDSATPAESELRKAANAAKAEVRAQQVLNEQYTRIMQKEWEKVTRGEAPASGLPITDEMAKAIAGRMIGSIRLGIKQFDAFIKELRANLEEGTVTGLKPTLIRTWNAIREKHGLDEATDAGFDAAMSNTVDVDVEQAIEAAKAETPQPAPAASVAEPERLYSTKNAFSAEARDELGMGERPPVTPQTRAPSVSMAEEIGRTAAGRERIDLLIGELMATPRAVTPLENDLLNFRNAELGNKLDAALRKQIDSRKSGDSAQEAVAEREAIVFRKQKQDLIEMVLEPIGTAAGRALQARKAVINQDYTLERLSLEYEAAYGEAPNTAKLAEMQKQIDDLNASIKELERQLAEESAKNEDLETRLKDAHDTAVQDTKPAAPPKKATVLERLAKEGKEQVESGFKKLSAMLGKVYSIEGAAADLTEALIEIATGYSKQGVVRLADFLNRVGKRMGPKAKEIQAELISAWNTVRGNSTMTEQEQITNKIDILDPDTIGRAARDLHRFVIERDGLDASAEGREAAVVAVHAILVDILPDITRDEVARAMSGIGIYSELNKDDIEVIRRDQKAQLLSLQQIEDWMKGIAPPATGQERPPVSDEQRLLRRMVNEAKKAAGLVTTTEGQLRSALDAAKRMARNRIADLTKAIESGTRIERSRRVLEDPSGELQTLQAERDALQKLYNEAFGKPELSDAQKLNRAEKALDRAISNLESDLKAGKLYDDAPKAPVTSPEIDAKRAALAALKASREEMRLQSGEAQARSDAAYERLLKQREADLAQRLADGDFAPPGKKPERKFTPEMLKTMQSIAKQRQELKKQSDAWVFENRHIVYKAYMKGPVAGAHMLRKLLTTLDQSLIGRQGWLLGLTHPKIYAKSARQAFASNPVQARSMFPTEQDLFNTQAALDADANWVRLEKIGKLAVTDVHGGINREEDSRFVPEWFDKVWGIGGSERAGSAFINTQRRLVFRNLVSKLSTKLDGKNASLSNADLRVIGNLVNVASGRGGIGKWTGALDALTLVFFSPRWWVSRLSWWVGQPVWHDSRWFGGDGASTEVRQMAAAEWAKQAAAQIAVMGVAVAGLTAAFGAGGDDEEWEYYVDPRSPNFGRIRIGNTRIDMTAGLGQHLSLMSRLATGTQVDRWETKDVDKADLVGKHLRGKLAPVPSAFWDYLEGQSIGGEKFGTKEWIRDHSLPLIFQEANTAIKEEGAFTGGLLSAWMFFGGTAQTYEARVKSRVDITNELRAMKKQGKSPEQIQATLNKHLAHMAGLEAKDHVRTANPEEAAALQTVIKGESSPELLAAIQKEKYDIILNASGRVSSDPKRIHDDKGFTGSDDASRRSARSLVKTMIPDVNEAIDLYEDAYRARNNSIYEKNGKMKAAVWAGRARIRSIYAAE